MHLPLQVHHPPLWYSYESVPFHSNDDPAWMLDAAYELSHLHHHGHKLLYPRHGAFLFLLGTVCCLVDTVASGHCANDFYLYPPTLSPSISRTRLEVIFDDFIFCPLLGNRLIQNQ